MISQTCVIQIYSHIYIHYIHHEHTLGTRNQYHKMLIEIF